MALCWSWAWGPETYATLISEAGFSTATTNFSLANYAQSSTEVYSYTGSPTRYSISARINDGNTYHRNQINLPAAAHPSTAKGLVAVPVRMEYPYAGNDHYVIEANFPNAGTSIGAAFDNGTGTMKLYVDSVFKGSTPAVDWSVWQYITLEWDASSNPWSGKIYINGTLQISATDAQNAETTTGFIRLGAGTMSNNNTWYGQVAIYDNPSTDVAEATEPNTFVTRVIPNADGTNVGTWAPSTGSDDYAVVDPPIDSATFTSEASPSANDKVEVLTNAGSATLATALGVTPATVYGSTLHSFSTGAAITAEVGFGDGSAENLATAATVAPATTTYLKHTITTKPSGGAWTGSDSPRFVYKIDSV